MLWMQLLFNYGDEYWHLPLDRQSDNTYISDILLCVIITALRTNPLHKFAESYVDT